MTPEVKAAAEALARYNAGIWPVEPLPSEVRSAEVAIAAAAPHIEARIRAQVAAEVRAGAGRPSRWFDPGCPGYRGIRLAAFRDAARIVEGP